VQPKLRASPSASPSTSTRTPPTLERPPSASQSLSIDPERDPAERQADEIGARIGRHLGSASAISSGLLPETVRSVAERHLGVDLSGTELRADGQAARHADGYQALAVTEGSTISFASGQLSTGSHEGRALLGHELTHVAQQRVHGAAQSPRRVPQRKEQTAQFALSDLLDEAGEFLADKFWDLVREVAPSVEPYLRNPAQLWNDIVDSATSALDDLISAAFAVLANARERVGSIGESISKFFAELGPALTALGSNDCGPLFALIGKARTAFMEFAEPLIAPLREVFDSVSGAVGGALKWLDVHVLELLKQVGGAAWKKISAVVDSIGGVITRVKEAGATAWKWLSDKLGFAGSSDGPGIWEWIKSKVSALWEGVKPTLLSWAGPAKKVLVVLAAVSPIGPTLAVLKYGPKVIGWVKQLWAYVSNPQRLVEAKEFVAKTLLPGAIAFLREVAGAVGGAAQSAAAALSQVDGVLGEVIGALGAVNFLKSVQQIATDAVAKVEAGVAWAKENIPALLHRVETWATGAWQSLKPILDTLVKVVSAVANPFKLPFVVLSEVWLFIPRCLKHPIVQFVLDTIISALEATPSVGLLVAMGPLWPPIHAAALGFFHKLKSLGPDEAIRLTNRVADVIIGGIDFAMGLGKGMLRGIWDGVIGPFEMVFQLIEVVGKLGDALDAFTRSLSPADLPLLGTIRAAAANLGHSFWAALRSVFSGGGGGVATLFKIVGGIWNGLMGAAESAGVVIADKFVQFIRLPDFALGDKVGFAAGFVVSQVVLAILSGGASEALEAVSGPLGTVLRAIVRVNEAVGELFEPILHLFGPVARAIQKLFGSFSSSEAISALGRELGTMWRELEQLVSRFLGRFSEKAGARAAGEAIEKGIASEGARAVEAEAADVARGVERAEPPIPEIPKGETARPAEIGTPPGEAPAAATPGELGAEAPSPVQIGGETHEIAVAPLRNGERAIILCSEFCTKLADKAATMAERLPTGHAARAELERIAADARKAARLSENAAKAEGERLAGKLDALAREHPGVVDPNIHPGVEPPPEVAPTGPEATPGELRGGATETERAADEAVAQGTEKAKYKRTDPQGNEIDPERGLTKEQNEFYREKIRSAATPEAADAWRYERFKARMGNLDPPPAKIPSREEWQKQVDNFLKRTRRGIEVEPKALDAVDARQERISFTDETGVTTITDGIRPPDVVESKYVSPDTADPVLYDSDQLRAQAQLAKEGKAGTPLKGDGNLEVVISSEKLIPGPPPAPRPSAPVARKYKVKFHNTETGELLTWDVDRGRWK
jgi:hypothetical protein